MTARLLPIPDDPRFAELIEGWGRVEAQLGTSGQFPRSVWLGEFERLLREFYPQSNSASRKLTARHYAPFFLAAGPNVP